MTARQFMDEWHVAVSHMRHVTRAAENVPDLDPNALAGLRQAMHVAVDLLALAMKRAVTIEAALRDEP